MKSGYKIIKNPSPKKNFSAFYVQLSLKLKKLNLLCLDVVKIIIHILF